MKLSEEFPNLCNFIGSWFPDADLEKLTDEAVALKFSNTVSQRELAAVVSEARQAMDCVPQIWEELGEEANRHFQNPENARKWLSSILGTIQQEMDKGTS